MFHHLTIHGTCRNNSLFLTTGKRLPPFRHQMGQTLLSDIFSSRQDGWLVRPIAVIAVRLPSCIASPASLGDA
ncbi:hypothetical protein PG995_008426 [Apiospora arundinis]|uniref:Uncharacterized protein n=1 Tax=Apiospora arundinis TaxID=335852 RepID=A0ABR2I0V1_9PEZI